MRRFFRRPARPYIVGVELPPLRPSVPLVPSVPDGVPEPLVVSPADAEGASAGSDGSIRGGHPGQLGPAGVKVISTGTAIGTGCATTIGQARVVKLTGALVTQPSLVE